MKSVQISYDLFVALVEYHPVSYTHLDVYKRQIKGLGYKAEITKEEQP